MARQRCYRVVGICPDGSRVAVVDHVSREGALRVVCQIVLDEQPFCGCQIEVERPPSRPPSVSPNSLLRVVGIKRDGSRTFLLRGLTEDVAKMYRDFLLEHDQFGGEYERFEVEADKR